MPLKPKSPRHRNKLAEEQSGFGNPSQAQTEAAEQLIHSQVGIDVAEKFFIAEHRLNFEAITQVLATDEATPIRDALLRQHERNPARLADYTFALLCAILPNAVRGQSLTLQRHERVELVEKIIPRCELAMDKASKGDQEDLRKISGALAGNPDVAHAMLILCFRDRWKFQKAFKSLLTQWQQIYKPCSASRRQDVIALNDHVLKTKKRDEYAAEVYRLAGLRIPKTATQSDSACHTLRGDRAKLKLR